MSKQEIQNSESYKKMNTYHACEIAEGFGSGENASDEESQVAWQYLYDNKAYQFLQGWYGRTMESLLNQGLIFK